MISDIGKSKDFCPECGGYLINIPERGEVVCEQCGLVIKERLVDFSHDGRRSFTNQEKNSRKRTGAPISPLVPYMALTNVINRKAIENPDLKRAAKWNSRVSWQKRNMLIASSELKRITSNLGLPKYITEAAFSLYKKAYEKHLLRGRSINGIVAACIYYAVRIKSLPRSLNEIIGEASANGREIRKAYSTLINGLKLKNPSTDPMTLISRYSADLGLDQETQKLVIRILSTFLSRYSASGKDPKGLCAGAIYLACKIKGIKMRQVDITKLVGITEVTLRSRYKDIAKKLNIPIESR